MAKRPKGLEEGVGDHPAEKASEELFRVATMVPRTIVNGHVLTVGTVIELTQDEIETHRANGVPLDDVHPEDKREVYSVREPYKVPDSSE